MGVLTGDNFSSDNPFRAYVQYIGSTRSVEQLNGVLQINTFNPAPDASVAPSNEIRPPGL